MTTEEERLIAAHFRASAVVAGGVGTELKKLLSSWGIAPSGCGCSDKAALWDRKGVEWCDAHQEELVASLEASARKHDWLRYVPLKSIGCRGAVLLAIRRAKG